MTTIESNTTIATNVTSECNICFKKTDSSGINQCGTCKQQVFLQCSINELKGLCPICDREAINEEFLCQWCNTSVRIGQWMEFNCDDCEDANPHVLEGCLTCFGNWKINCTIDL